jgi:hypothetical protein
MARSAALAVLVLALAVTPAAAQTPAPCNGAAPNVVDATGDVAQDAGRSAPAGLDLTQAFFRTDAGRTYGFIRVKDLSAAPPEDPTVISRHWRLVWAAGNAQPSVEARLNRDGTLTFTSSAGDTTGVFVEGADGYIAILLPASLANDGAVLAKPWAISGYNTGAGNQTFSVNYGGPGDRAPDESAGRDFTVGPCEAPKAPPAPGAAKPAVPAAGSSAQAAELELVGVGRRTHGKRLTVKLRSTGRLSKVVVTLKRGSKTIGTGRLARIDGTATVAVRAKTTLRKGRYTLVARAGSVLTTRNLTLK